MRPATTLRYYAERLGLRLRWRELLFYECPLAAQLTTGRSQPEVIPLAADDLPAIADFGGWRTRDDSMRILRSNPQRRLLGALADGKLLGTCWLETGTADLPDFDLQPQLDRGSCHVNFVHVQPGARQRGVARQLVEQATAEGFHMGCDRAVLCCAPDNRPMTRLMASLGWTGFSTVNYRRFLILRRYGLRATTSGRQYGTFSCRSAAAQIMRWESSLKAAA